MCHFRFDVAAWVKNHATESEKQKSAQTQGGLKVAGSDPNKKEDDGIGIMMALDKDEFTRRQERAAEAEMKRQQNALPAWHLKSTITGDLTALGIKETARAEEAAKAIVGGGGSNDDILRGLGVVGGGGSKNGGLGVEESHTGLGDMDGEKPKVGQDDADCEFLFFISLSLEWVLKYFGY